MDWIVWNDSCLRFLSRRAVQIAQQRTALTLFIECVAFKMLAVSVCAILLRELHRVGHVNKGSVKRGLGKISGRRNSIGLSDPVLPILKPKANFEKCSEPLQYFAKLYRAQALF